MLNDSQNVILYFANSWSGGGAVRLGHYYKHISRPNYKFVINSQMAHGFKLNDSRVTAVQPTYFQRFFKQNENINSFNLTNSAVFSHGAPIKPDSSKFILHLNNALPLVYDKVSLDWKLKLKMAFLASRLRKSAEFAQVITVESESTRLLVEEKWGERFASKCQILTNGVDSISLNRKDTQDFALTIGTYPYKRLDLVEELFQEFCGKDLTLKIVGATTYFKSKKSETFTNMRYDEMRGLIASCKYYITMSEIENCSISFLEAMYHSRTIICSNISSHSEFLTKHGYISEEIRPGVLLAYPPKNLSTPIPTWADIVNSTYKIIEGLS